MLAYLIPVPYELIKAIFGQFIADNFNTIMLVIAVIGITVRIFKKRRKKSDWLEKAQNTQNKRFEYLNNGIINNHEEIRKKKQEIRSHSFEAWAEKNNKDGYAGNIMRKTKWYPTGWTFNDETQLWEPPDYVKQESKERYRKAHEGRPPTFEEWKAAREAEQNKDSTNT